MHSKYPHYPLPRLQPEIQSSLYSSTIIIAIMYSPWKKGLITLPMLGGVIFKNVIGFTY